MAFFDRLRQALGGKHINPESTTSTTTTPPPPEIQPQAPAKTRSKRKNIRPLEKTPKDMATDRGEPYAPPPPEIQPPAPAKTRSKRKNIRPLEKTPKDMATDRGEPYVTVVSVNLDSNNIGSGSFELDWNDKFIAQLVRAGFQRQTNESEHVIVDRWFQTVCRNIVLETYEQEQADPDVRQS